MLLGMFKILGETPTQIKFTTVALDPKVSYKTMYQSCIKCKTERVHAILNKGLVCKTCSSYFKFQ